MNSIYIYAPKNCGSGLKLAEAMGATVIRHFDGLRFWDKSKIIQLVPDSFVINWGGFIPPIQGVKVVSPALVPLTKFEELQRIPHYTSSVTVYQHYEKYSTMYARKNNSRQGADLLLGCSNPDFYTYYEKFLFEYRLHYFNGEMLKVGVKQPKDEHKIVESHDLWKQDAGLSHPWVRTELGGWTVKYGDTKVVSTVNTCAIYALNACGIIFGSVDIGKTEDGVYKVLSVNRAPYLETEELVSLYKEKFEKLFEPHTQPVPAAPSQLKKILAGRRARGGGVALDVDWLGPVRRVVVEDNPFIPPEPEDELPDEIEGDE